MTTIYPITERRSLNAADRLGLLRRKVRSDLPKPDAHHVLVYRVEGQYVLDTDRMRGDDERVVSATHVSVVDTRRDAPVAVNFQIPSADASNFDVTVTFLCTVTEPVAVVRDGVDGCEALWGYLQAHSRIFDIGLDFQTYDVNGLRRALSAQVTAYTTIKPPHVPGMTVSLGSVAVGNPEFLSEYQEKHRDKDVEGRLAMLEQENEQRLRTGAMLGDHSMESAQQAHAHNLGDQKQVHNESAALSAARHRRQESAEQADFEREQLDKSMSAVGADPRRILMTAFATGKISAAALSERIQELDRLDAEGAQRQLQLDRDHRREIEGVRHADTRENIRWKREQAERREERDRDDRIRREEQIREDERERFRARVDLLKQAANNGHFDMVNLQADRLYAEVVGIPAATADARAEIPTGANSSTLMMDEATTRVNEDDD